MEPAQPEKTSVSFPDVLALDMLISGNPIRQIGQRGRSQEGQILAFSRGRLAGFTFTPTDGTDEVLKDAFAEPNATVRCDSGFTSNAAKWD